jgi:hypothetical protein
VFFGGGEISETPNCSVIASGFSSCRMQDINGDGIADMSLVSTNTENLYKIFYGEPYFDLTKSVDTVMVSLPPSKAKLTKNYIIGSSNR